MFGIAQIFRSVTPGVRPGGSNRPLKSGEFFLNQKDGVLCYLDDQGALVTAFFLNSAGMSSWLATLPTSPPTPGSGTWWNNAGTPTQA